MRKIFWIMALLSILNSTGYAKEYHLFQNYLAIDIPDNYVVILPDSINEKDALLIGKKKEEIKDFFKSNNAILYCQNPNTKVEGFIRYVPNMKLESYDDNKMFNEMIEDDEFIKKVSEGIESKLKVKILEIKPSSYPEANYIASKAYKKKDGIDTFLFMNMTIKWHKTYNFCVVGYENSYEAEKLVNHMLKNVAYGEYDRNKRDILKEYRNVPVEFRKHINPPRDDSNNNTEKIEGPYRDSKNTFNFEKVLTKTLSWGVIALILLFLKFCWSKLTNKK